MDLTYFERCELAATHQGLDPVVEALATAGLPVDVQNTGGYCMAAVVPCPGGVVVITGWDTDGYLVGAYPGTAWEDADGGEYVECLDLAGTVEQVRADVLSLGGEVA